MNNQKKCSSKKHADINAISYCQECNIFMCNKCITNHDEVLDFHHKYNLNEHNINEIFTGICKESKHKDELDFYCKNHNQLCCAACLSKIKDKGNGQHTDCNVCLIEEIKDEKKNKLKENIKYLEDCSFKIENSINELKKIFEEIQGAKEELKMKVSKIFTQIRNELNEREDKILFDIDDKFNNIYFKEEIIHRSENLPNELKKSIEKGKLIEKEWNYKKLNKLINDCISIENNITNIKDINENIGKCNLNKNKIVFIPEKENEVNEFLEKIKIFGKIEINNEDNILYFQFKPGKNYILNNNGLIATKNNGGDNWNCTIVGNKEIPLNKVSKWKIKINNFELKSYTTRNVLIGIGPDNTNNEKEFYNKCWSFICGDSQLLLKSSNLTKYNNKHKEKLNKGDIIEVIVDRKIGNLTFSINGENYGIACSEIPKEDILYPIVMIYVQNQIVEIIQN